MSYFVYNPVLTFSDFEIETLFKYVATCEERRRVTNTLYTEGLGTYFCSLEHELNKIHSSWSGTSMFAYMAYSIVQHPMDE